MRFFFIYKSSNLDQIQYNIVLEPIFLPQTSPYYTTIIGYIVPHILEFSMKFLIKNPDFHIINRYALSTIKKEYSQNLYVDPVMK